MEQNLVHLDKFMHFSRKLVGVTLSITRNKMLNIKTTFDTIQILGKEEFSKRTNTPNWEGSDHAKTLTKPISSS